MIICCTNSNEPAGAGAAGASGGIPEPRLNEGKPYWRTQQGRLYTRIEISAAQRTKSRTGKSFFRTVDIASYLQQRRVGQCSESFSVCLCTVGEIVPLPMLAGETGTKRGTDSVRRLNTRTIPAEQPSKTPARPVRGIVSGLEVFRSLRLPETFQWGVKQEVWTTGRHETRTSLVRQTSSSIPFAVQLLAGFCDVWFFPDSRTKTGVPFYRASAFFWRAKRHTLCGLLWKFCEKISIFPACPVQFSPLALVVGAGLKVGVLC